MNWKKIPSLGGLYLAGEDGNIYRRLSTAPLTPVKAANGRHRVSLSIGGKRLNGSVSRLVCEAFHGPCPEGHECAHEDGVRTNNVPSNLAWKTPKANYADRDKHGTTAKGSRNGSSKMTEATAKEALAALATGERQVDIAARLGVSQSAISLLKSRKNWAAINITPPTK